METNHYIPVLAGIFIAALLGHTRSLANPAVRVTNMALAWILLALAVAIEVFLKWDGFWKAGGAAVTQMAIMVVWAGRPVSGSGWQALRTSVSALIVTGIFTIAGLWGI